MREFEDIEDSFEPGESAVTPEGLRDVVIHGSGGMGAGVGVEDEEKLEAEAARHRVLLMRGGAVIAVTTVISIGGALLIHGMFAGVFVLAMFFHWGGKLGSGGHGDMALVDGNGKDEILVVDDGEPQRPLASALGKAASATVANVMAALPPLPEAPARSVEVAPPQIAENPVNVPNNLGTVRVAVPTNLIPPANPQESVIVVPPAPTASPTANATAAGVAGGNAAAIAMGEGDDEPTVHLYTTNGGGRGTGSGSGSGRGTGAGRGRGVDRGPSGADRPEPVVLDNPQPAEGEIPTWLRFDPPKNRVTFSVMVLETGAVGEIKVTESSGRPQVDAFYRELLMTWKYSPAIEGGKPVARAKEISFDPRI